MVLRIFKVIAISGFLIDLECIKFVFGRDSARVRWRSYNSLLYGMSDGLFR